MLQKTECVAMLLAGGQGSRLGVLTRSIAKPALPYGGKYRIIDFPLSNCVNSGIDTVGVLTQYQPLELNEYIGSGQPWDLDRLQGGVHILPPYQKSKGGDWYLGTANAVYQNISFLERYRPEYVLILSGDHVYKMDYSKMLSFHKNTGADCTIAVLEVPYEEAPRFGIMNTDETGRIYEFEEKPEHPKSNRASMGVYMFSYERLRHYLELDHNNPDSENDFGKNVIPAMLEDGQVMMAYPFEGYWKDVGTIDALWESNMDILNPKVELDLSDHKWRIYSRNPVMPPHYASSNAFVQNSLVSEGCEIYGTVDFSVLHAGVSIEKGAVVCDSIVMPGAAIHSGAVVQYAIVGENAVIGEKAVVGSRPEDTPDKDRWGVAVIGPGVTVGPSARVQPKEMMEDDVEEGRA